MARSAADGEESKEQRDFVCTLTAQHLFAMAQPASFENHKKALDLLLSSINVARTLSTHLVDPPAGPGPRSGSVASLSQAVRSQKSLGTSMAMRLKSTFDALKSVEDAMATEDTQNALSTVRDLSITAPPVTVSRKRK
jgi:hypothetical protein